MTRVSLAWVCELVTSPRSQWPQTTLSSQRQQHTVCQLTHITHDLDLDPAVMRPRWPRWLQYKVKGVYQHTNKVKHDTEATHNMPPLWDAHIAVIITITRNCSGRPMTTWVGRRAYQSYWCQNGPKWCDVTGVRNPMKISDIGFLKTEPTSKFKNRKLGFRGSVFKNRLRRIGDGFSLCLIHNSSCGMIGSTVKVFLQGVSVAASPVAL